jgi:hypothetical protein
MVHGNITPPEPTLRIENETPSKKTEAQKI